MGATRTIMINYLKQSGIKHKKYLTKVTFRCGDNKYLYRKRVLYNITTKNQYNITDIESIRSALGIIYDYNHSDVVLQALVHSRDCDTFYGCGQCEYSLFGNYMED
jgi:hypothetical protein